MPDSVVPVASDAALAGHPAGLRRTFAIISHPDAGKTTLTEKLLLFGGAIQMAGAVKGRKVLISQTMSGREARQEQRP